LLKASEECRISKMNTFYIIIFDKVFVSLIIN